MGYKALVQQNVTKALTLIKDLAEDVLLQKSSDIEFDFSSGTMLDDVGETQLPIKAVVIESRKKSDKVNTIERELLFATKGLGDVNAYDRVYIRDAHDETKMVLWKFGPKIIDNGYIILAKIYREVTSG